MSNTEQNRSTVFTFRAPDWVNQERPKNVQEQLDRVQEAATAFYALGVQTGVHAMIEWCGVMREHAKMLREAYDYYGIEPDQVDQHTGVHVHASPYMVEYLCEKLGCQLKPFIRGNKEKWRNEIDKWFL